MEICKFVGCVIYLGTSQALQSCATDWGKEKKRKRKKGIAFVEFEPLSE